MSLPFHHFLVGETSAPSLNLTEQSKSVSAPFVKPIAVQSPPPLVLVSDLVDSTSAHYFIDLPDNHWSNSDERLFSRLAEMKALRTATEDDLNTLNELRVRRRKVKNPMSAEEVSFHYQRRQMESKLIQDLQVYVRFLDTARGT